MLGRGGLRVAVDATPLLGRRTGVGAFVAGALEALAAASDLDLDLSAFALSLRAGAGLGHQLPPGVRATRRAMPAGPLLAAWSRADVPPVEWWTGPVDVVHGTNFVSPPSRRAAEVVTVHDLTPLRHPELASPATRRFPALVGRAIARGAMVHAPSAFVAAEVVELLGADAASVRAVAHGGPPAAPSGPSPVPGAYVLAVGTVEPRKAMPTLVRAFDAVAGDHAGLRLVIAGPPGWGQAALDDAVASARHGDRVIRLGWVDDASVGALVAGAALLAFPSLYEGFGFPPLQAMAAGVPVVASRAGALPEVLGDAAHLVAPGDAEALAGGLRLVLDDEGLRADLVARGRQRVGALSWARCAAGLAELYHDAALRSGARASA